MPTLFFLLKNLAELSQDISAIQIDNITNDSRTVTKNTLFLAYPGEQSDGRHYISQAIEKGAVAVCYESGESVPERDDVPLIPILNLKAIQSTIAARFYDFPSTKIPVIGVTGTNGKTSITHYIAQALNAPFEKAGIIGTLGYGFLSSLHKTVNTTPDSVQLQKMFAQLIEEGATAIAMEVSSHALVQQRVNDVQFHTAVFTNLTQDHLDFHHTMENYQAAKELLFQQPHLKNAVINIDDAAGKYFAEKYRDKLTVITYATQDKTADILVEKCIPTEHGFDLTVKTPWGRGSFHLPLIGEFNIANALAVLAVFCILNLHKNTIKANGSGSASDCETPSILNKLSHLTTVSGRMQLLRSNNSPTIIVDYAHTPDALEKALQSIRTHCNGKLWCVFGCGGNRDKTKRPTMGAIAEKFSDHIIITNDNPRHENPETIAQEIIAGIKNNYLLELDRVKAIEKAIELADKNDWILIAGKGHETEQIIGDKIHSHNDVMCVQQKLAHR